MIKKLVSLTITLVDGSSVTIADSTTSSAGTRAFAQFEAKDIITASDTYIPYHAVLKVAKTETSEDVTAPTDEFCNAE